MVEVLGALTHDAWVLSPFDIMIGGQHKKIDLVSGKIELFEPSAYVDSSRTYGKKRPRLCWSGRRVLRAVDWPHRSADSEPTGKAVPSARLPGQERELALGAEIL